MHGRARLQVLPARRAAAPGSHSVTYTEACIILNMIPRIGPVRLRRLLDVFGEPQAILRAPADSPGVGSRASGRRSRAGSPAWESEVDLAAELALRP